MHNKNDTPLHRTVLAINPALKPHLPPLKPLRLHLKRILTKKEFKILEAISTNTPSATVCQALRIDQERYEHLYRNTQTKLRSKRFTALLKEERDATPPRT